MIKWPCISKQDYFTKLLVSVKIVITRRNWHVLLNTRLKGTLKSTLVTRSRPYTSAGQEKSGISVYQQKKTQTGSCIETETLRQLLVDQRQMLPCPSNTRANLRTLLSLLLGLQVVVGKVGGSTTDEHKSVDTDSQAGGIAGRRRGGDGAWSGRLGGWVASLHEDKTCQ